MNNPSNLSNEVIKFRFQLSEKSSIKPVSDILTYISRNCKLDKNGVYVISKLKESRTFDLSSEYLNHLIRKHSKTTELMSTLILSKYINNVLLVFDQLPKDLRYYIYLGILKSLGLDTTTNFVLG